ncbi:MAG: hypothetical protein U0670_10870 [Anaerolineae bacterium]
MPHVKTERLPGESIIVSTYEGAVSVTDVMGAIANIESLVHAIGGDVYLIIDVRQTTSSFKDIMDILRRPRTERTDEEHNPIRVRLIMVGSTAMSKLYVQAYKSQQQERQPMPLFVDLEAAVETARIALAAAHREQPAAHP